MTIHIATSAELGRVVRRGLREPVAFVPDNLLVGPCAEAPEVHAQARCDHWAFQGRERARWLASFRNITKAIDSPEDVIVWTSRLWADAVTRWALCAWRLLRRPASPDLGLVVLGDPAGRDDATSLDGGPLRVTPADARRGLDGVRSLSLTRARELALFWRKLCGRSPILSSSGGRSGPGREPLHALGTYQAAFFPRAGARGLVLSRFDELLLSCLGKQGSTPVEVFVSRSAAGEELRQWLTLTGDVFLARRLAQWAHHDGDAAALVSEPVESENIMKSARYRLSDKGDAILQHGLAEIARGAPLVVWGATAYDPSSPWVVVDDAAGRQSLQRPGPHSAQGAKG